MKNNVRISTSFLQLYHCIFAIKKTNIIELRETAIRILVFSDEDRSLMHVFGLEENGEGFWANLGGKIFCKIYGTRIQL